MPVAGPWSKFFWSDWRGDPALRLCSLAAQGLWMQMLCIAAEADPIGYVLVHGRTLSTTDLAQLTGAPEAAIQSALAELARNGVFSADRKGRIYSRRMVRDAKTASRNQKNGKLGGNPSLRKTRGIPEWDNPPDKPPDKARCQMSEARRRENADEAESPTLALGHDPPAAVSERKFRWPADRAVPIEWIAETAVSHPRADGYAEAEAFQRYWSEGKGARTVRAERGWRQTWRNWIARSPPGSGDWRDRYGYEPALHVRPAAIGGHGEHGAMGERA